jgi:hypothetical protein
MSQIWKSEYCPVAMILAAFSSAQAMANLVIYDGTFLDSNWTMIVRPYGPNGGTGSGSQVLVGGAGDNGPARETTNHAGANLSGSYNASIYTAFTYNPAVGGPLTDLSISFDSRYVTGLSAIGIAVEQAGLVWMSGGAINTPNWQTYTFTPGPGSWFLINPSGGVAGPGPDFSAAGAPMRFGYYTGNGTGAGSFPYAHTGLTDNFTVRFVPAPGALALLGVGGLIMTRQRWR